MDEPNEWIASDWNIMRISIDQSDSSNNQLIIGNGSPEHESLFKHYLNDIKRIVDDEGITTNNIRRFPNFPLYMSHLPLSGDPHWAPWMCSPCAIKYDPSLGFEFCAPMPMSATNTINYVLKATFDGNTFTVTQWPATA